VIESRIKRSS